MRAIVLSAGQGRRLLPLTAQDPKCLLAVDGQRPILELQLAALARCGVSRASVLVGFGAERVERFLARTPIPGLAVETLFNPFYATSDNLVTCWLARIAMTEDFLLLNGDTLVDDGVLRRVLMGASAPVSVTIDHKADYDDDDMKVSVDRKGQLLAVGKNLPPATVNGESIGLLSFRDQGVKAFCEALDEAVRREDSLGAWYLSVINDLAQRMPVATTSIRGLWWQEIDDTEDLKRARSTYLARRSQGAFQRVASASGSAEPY